MVKVWALFIAAGLTAATGLTTQRSAGLASGLVPAQQKPPVFRTKIDLMQLDVTVLDKKGEPVRGLTQADFELFEDNKPQSIQAFKAIEVAGRVVAGPAWADKVTPDVTTNEIDNARIFVLVIDDGFGMNGGNEVMQDRPMMPDPWAIREMKKTAELFIQTLGPEDLAGVVFTGTTAKFSQNLTSDRARLVKAVQAYPDLDGTLFFEKAGRRPDAVAQCYAAKEIVRLMDAVVQQLASLPDRRKSVVYFGGSLPWAEHPTADPCGTYWMWHEVFVSAQQGSVTINPIQTAGMVGVIDRYLTVADYTGGHAVVNTNDFVPGVKRIFLESSSYYLLAYEPTRDIADGTFRRITVKVKGRPDVEVVTKRNYWAPRAPKPNDPVLPPPSEAVKALEGLLPDSRLALRVTAAPFASATVGSAATIGLALGVRQPAFANRTPETIDLLIRSFTATGDPKVGDDQSVPITVPAARADADISRYEVLARIDVAKPGSYHLRLSARSQASDVRGSVYVDVDVPDFKKDKLSLSGVVVNNATAATPTAPLRLLRDVVTFTPTTERAFSAGDIVTTLVRVYQGGNDKLAPVTMKIAVLDAAGKPVVSQNDIIAVDRFSTDRAADFQYRLPLNSLPVGEYLLSFESTVGKVTAKRDVRFEKR